MGTVIARELRLIRWPFDNGLPDVRMGAGAQVLAADERLRDGLERAGWRVSDDAVPAVDAEQAEVARVIELVRRLAARVRAAVSDGAFPFVLAGNCNSALGTVAGVHADGLGVVWLDAHADFDDPEENASGFFDVMGLAMLSGRGWRALRATIPGHRAICEDGIVLAGVRDLEPYQRRRLAGSAVSVAGGAIEEREFEQSLARLAARAERIYLHVDLDVLDAACGRANEYAAAGGPDLARVLECVRAVCERFPVVAAALTAYDPRLDEDGRVVAAARAIAAEIARGVAD